ncbi:MAG: hypothetical protein EP333_04040, partial [Bacteroidetes bacterium]
YFAFLISSRVLKAGFIKLDMLMLAIPIALGIQRLGCFSAGCCYGVPYEGIFNVQYHLCTPVGHSHIEDGLIGFGASSTSGLFPIQLLLSIGSFALAGFVWWGRRIKLFREGYHLLILALYLCLMFVADFWREGYNNPDFAVELYGLKKIQWFELAIALILFGLYFFKKRPKSYSNTIEERTYAYRNALKLLIPASIAVLLFWSWFTDLERITLIVNAIPAFVLSLERLRFPAYGIFKGVTVSLIILAISVHINLNGQKKSPYTDITLNYKQKGLYSYSQLDLGADVLKYSHNHDYNTVTTSTCDGTSTHVEPTGPTYSISTNSYYVNYSANRLRIENANKYFLHRFIGGGNFGISSEYANNNTERYKVGGIHFQYIFDSEWVGAGAGFSFGRYSPTTQVNQEYFFNYLKTGDFPVWKAGPILYGRVFPRRIAYAYGSMGNDMFSYGYNNNDSWVEYGFGSGLGRHDGTKLEFGVINYNRSNDIGLSSTFQIYVMNRFGIHLKVINNFSVKSFQGIGGISYRFNHQKLD